MWHNTTRFNTLTASTSSGGRLNRDTSQSKSLTLPDWAAQTRAPNFPLEDKPRRYKDQWDAQHDTSVYCRLGYSSITKPSTRKMPCKRITLFVSLLEKTRIYIDWCSVDPNWNACFRKKLQLIRNNETDRGTACILWDSEKIEAWGNCCIILFVCYLL